MTDSVTALVLIASFLLVMAALHFFKTLDGDLLHAWRTPLVAGFVAGVVLRLAPVAGWHELATGVLVAAAVLYVRLNGRESEPVDGMLLGAVTGAAAVLPLLLRGRDGCLAVAECVAAGAVAGYGVTFAAFHVADRSKQFVIDAITFAAAIGIAFAPRAIARTGVSARDVALIAVVAVPLLVLAAVFNQWPEIRAELRHEASLGFIDDADVRRTAHPLLRLGGGGWSDRRAHREFVRVANEIALRKRQQRNRSEEMARLYQLEIIKLRMRIRDMSRIDRIARSGHEEEQPSDTMARSK